MLTPEGAYSVYIAHKLHFKDKSYDYFKYHGKHKIRMPENLRFVSANLAKIQDIYKWLLAQAAERDVFPFIKDICYSKEPTSAKHWENWTNKISNLPRVVEKDLYLLTLSDLISENGTHPRLVPMLLNKKINLETFLVLSMYNEKASKTIAKNLDANDPVIERLYFKSKKYWPFLKQHVGDKTIQKVKEFC